MRTGRCEFDQRLRRMNGGGSGFTLVELVIVVLILAILSVVAAGKIRETSSEAKINATLTQLDAFADAVELYHAQNGTYPASTNATNATTNLGPYLNPSFFKRQLAIASGQFSQSSRPVWVYNKSSTIEYGYLVLPYVNAEVAVKVEASRDDGVGNSGDIWVFDYRPSGYDFGHLYLFVVRSF
ncbi:MAG: prepilin-type N-terminal cleavage/methylation domain-containing protein [Planctomycetaceae bacterium]|nr:prepilin-type N-terminal cleavage/methylation domain-containing protein [Planctomycetales bacterium]MCB9937592.1 prepilin-type N-terminal cleavage/methylation domain-containing protein [Planctomycetaceae bacterium]